jgi:AbiJ N-terminal domain 3
VLRNPGDWSAEDLFGQLGAFDAGDARFGRFLEGLVSADVIPDEPAQRAIADVINPRLREAGGGPGEHRPRPAAVPGRPPRRAERIIASHPHMSDRVIGHSAGLAAKTVAGIRKSSSEEIPQSNARVGRDGRVRPLDSGTRRRRAAEVLTQQPDASLRDVARVVRISPATVLDVRKRLERGESPVPEKPAANAARTGASGNGAEADTEPNVAAAVPPHLSWSPENSPDTGSMKWEPLRIADH